MIYDVFDYCLVILIILADTVLSYYYDRVNYYYDVLTVVWLVGMFRIALLATYTIICVCCFDSYKCGKIEILCMTGFKLFSVVAIF